MLISKTLLRLDAAGEEQKCKLGMEMLKQCDRCGLHIEHRRLLFTGTFGAFFGSLLQRSGYREQLVSRRCSC